MSADARNAPAASGGDPYVEYIRGFFARWAPFYDWVAKPIGFAYAAAVRAAGAGPGRTVLDLCTGTGEIALRCARRGAIVTAVDLTPSMLARARRKIRGTSIRLVEMDVRDLAFGDGAFDVAVLSFALHDMPHRARLEALREAVRVARGGVIVLDYESPERGWGRAAFARVIASYESAYFPDSVARGGIAGAAADAGLASTRLARPVPGLFAIHRVTPLAAA